MTGICQNGFVSNVKNTAVIFFFPWNRYCFRRLLLWTRGGHHPVPADETTSALSSAVECA